MMDILQFEFMRNAFAAGLLASIACGVIGTLVVVNRLVFLSGAVAHTAYGGLGLASFMGWPVMPCAVGFSLAASGAMAAVTARDRHRSDTLIGVMWAGGMAFGILLLDFTPGYNVDLMSFLFGSILAVPVQDLWVMAGLDCAILLTTLIFYKNFEALSYDCEFAEVRGVPVVGLYFLLLAMVGVSVVMIIRVVGLILVIALLSIPPGIAIHRTNSLLGMMWRSTLLAALFCCVGLICAYHFDLTSGASIIAVAVVSYLFIGVYDFFMKKRGFIAR
ncbi:metal ABC transporter permease [Desulfobaculum bizertense]|uniref:Zinc transport system permease protein n=1 Tax=Desulfobaculum bizertense DSM 18034 TaxID=1121442 RepID=A0A1T4VJM4_9BACT|nr:metal ABC transporter permease [Desulfobaculum bizertense]SKA65068.1 zinc transport system permease protein [Desulfobaculum bizertense DSM 18034]